MQDETQTPEQTDKTYTQAELDGLLAKRDDLLGANKQLKQQLQDAQAAAKQFEGLNVDWLKQLQQKAHDDEESELLAKGQVDEVINKRLALHKADTDKTLASKDAAIAERDGKLQAMAQSIVKAELAQQAAKAGVLPEAVDDVLAIYGSQFTVSDNGKVVAVDGSLGKDGVSQLTPTEVFANLRDAKPYLFPKAQGIGATGAHSTPQNKSFKDMSSQERSELLQRDAPEFYRQTELLKQGK